MSSKKKLQLLTYSINLSLLFTFSTKSMAAIDTDMDTMVVTASGFEQQIKDAPASISVITSKELSNKPYRDITDAIKDIPGVNISGGGDKSDISIRGMDAKYTLILIDGKKVSTRETRPNSDNPGFEQGWLPPLAAIERIEVVKGPMSSLYGSDAMGGVINIITKKVTDKWQGSVRLESTFQDNSKASNYYTGDFSVMGPIISDILGIQLYGQYTDHPEDEFVSGHAEQKLRSINGKLSLNATESQKFDLDFGRSLQNSKNTPGKTSSIRSRPNVRDNRRNSLSLTHNGYFDHFSTTSFVTYEANNNPKRDMKIENTIVDTRAIIPFSINTLTIGGKYGHQELQDKGNKLENNVDKIKRWDYALFTEDEIQLLDNWSLTLGLRFNKDENYGSNWNPRIYTAWDINDNFTLKGGFSTGYSTPMLRQVVTDWGQATGGGYRNGVILGNPDLKPEKSDNYEMSIAYSNDYGLNTSATVFYTKYKNKIQSNDLCNDRTNSQQCNINGVGNFDFIQEWVNVDKADLKGLELMLKTPLFDQFSLNSSYTWTKTEQKTGKYKGRSLNRTPKQKFNTQLDWYVTEQWDLWAKIAYYGVESSTNRSGTKINYPGYTFWDLGGAYQVNNGAKIFAGIYNIFDKEVKNEDFGKTLEGRRYWVGTEINF